MSRIKGLNVIQRFEFQTETSPISHGKVLSLNDLTSTLPNIPNLLCPVSEDHSIMLHSNKTKATKF